MPVKVQGPRTERSRVDSVFAQLREDILSGRLAPGTKLSFPSLSQRYTASVGVTREALSRLSEQGLVVAEPQVGYHVPPVSREGLIDLTLARCEIEGAAIAASVRHGDLAWESRVVASHYTIERTPVWADQTRQMVSAEWSTLHADFHVALIEACPSRRLVDIAASLRDAAEIYRSWSHGVSLNVEHRDFTGEHLGIKEAALDRDAETASRLLKDHLQRTADLLLEHLSEHVEVG